MRICSHCRRCYDDHVEYCTGPDHTALSETRNGSCEIIPGYRLEVLLDSGLKGDLYSARQVECGQRCRVRILSPKRKSGQLFLREARHAAALFHPNLVDIYEAGAVNSTELYVVSEEPEGQTLREYLETAGIPALITTIELMDQTAEALHTIHREGLLHRALRPENIVLANDVGDRPTVRVKDIDFGGVIERSIIGNKFLIDTALDAVKYYAPEQFTGGRTSVQSDIYSLGIVLYEMLAGAPPFLAPKASGLIEMHRHQQPKEFRIDNFDLRALLTHTLSESLQKEHTKRHSSAQAFARQLRHMEQLATHVSTPPPAIVVAATQIKPSLPTVVSAAPARSEKSRPAPEPRNTVVASSEPGDEHSVPEIAADSYDPWMEPDVYSSIDNQPEPLVQLEIRVQELAVEPIPVEDPTSEEQSPKARLDRALRMARMRLRKHRSTVLELPRTLVEPSEVSEPESEITTAEEPDVIEPQIQPPVIEPIDELSGRIDETPSGPNFVQPDPDEITAVTARSRPAVIEWQQSDDDIPSIEDVMEELAKDNAEPAFGLEPPCLAETTKLEPGPDRPREDRTSGSNDTIQFLPSVMRRSGENSSLDLYPDYSILSGYGAAQTRFAFDYQTVLLGAGLVAIVLLFLVGNSMFKQYGQSPAPAAPPSIESVFSQPVQPQVAQSVSKKSPKSSQKLRAEDGSTGDTAAAPPSSSDSRPTPNHQEQPLRNAAQTQNASKPASVSSTLVISTENGKVKSTVQAGKRAADQKSPIAGNKVTGTTRPRVVNNPGQ